MNLEGKRDIFPWSLTFSFVAGRRHILIKFFLIQNDTLLETRFSNSWKSKFGLRGIFSFRENVKVFQEFSQRIYTIRFQEKIHLQENLKFQETNFFLLSCCKLWARLQDNPVVTRETSNHLVRFSTIYLCVKEFSNLVAIKNNLRNKSDS